MQSNQHSGETPVNSLPAELLEQAEAARLSASQQIPSESTPTWQMELLLSGGLIVGVVEVLGWFMHSTEHWRSPVSGAELQITLMMSMYIASVLVATVVTFGVHLILRCIWVALVGMHSIHPQGVVWENVLGSASSVARSRARLKNVPGIIEALDNFSTKIFAAGVSITWVLAFSVLSGVLFFCLIWLLRWLLLPSWTLLELLAISTLVFWLPLAIAQLIDVFAARWLRPENRLARWSTSIQSTLTEAMTPKPVALVTMLLLSHLGRWRGMLVFLSLTLLLPIGSGIFLIGKDRVSVLRSERILGRDTAQLLQRNHYADQRDTLSIAPYLPSMMVKDDYLPLRIPYFDIRMDRAIEACLSDHKPISTGDAGVPILATETSEAASLSCLESKIQIELDGAKIGTQLELAQSPPERSGAQTAPDALELLQMLDVRALAPGKHVLVIILPAREGLAPDKKPNRIVFWR